MVLDADFNEIFCAFTENYFSWGNFVIYRTADAWPAAKFAGQAKKPLNQPREKASAM